jgi:hypothetical protein
VQRSTAICPDLGHRKLQMEHDPEPREDHWPGAHDVLIPLLQKNPSLQGQHTDDVVAVQFSSMYSPTAQLQAVSSEFIW